MSYKIIKTLGLLGLLLVGLAITLSIWLDYRASAELVAAKEALREAGAPMTPEAAMPPAVPDEQNAASLYEALAEMETNIPEIAQLTDQIQDLIEAGGYDGHEAIYTFMLTEAEWDTLESLLNQAALKPYIKQLDQITALEYFRPNWDFEDGPSMLIPEIGLSRNAAQYLLFSAALALRSGNSAEASQRLQQVFVLSEHTAQGRTLISLLSSAAIRGMAYSFIEASTLQSADLKWPSTQTLLFSVDDLWQNALDVERVGLAAPTFEALLSGDSKQLEKVFGEAYFPPEIKFLRLPLTSWLLKYDYAAYLNWMRQSRAMAAKPYSETFTAVQKLEEEISRTAKQKFHVITALTMPTLSALRKRMAAIDGHGRITATALALLSYRAANNQYPDQLGSLVPTFLDAIPLDPFSGKNPVYQKTDEGFLLYSIGPNLIDDGGKMDDPFTFGAPFDDIAWMGRGNAFTSSHEE